MDGGVSSAKALPGPKIFPSPEVTERDDDEGKGDGGGTLTSSSKFSENSLPSILWRIVFVGSEKSMKPSIHKQSGLRNNANTRAKRHFNSSNIILLILESCAIIIEAQVFSTYYTTRTSKNITKGFNRNLRDPWENSRERLVPNTPLSPLYY